MKILNKSAVVMLSCFALGACVKNEALDLEKNYIETLTERAKEIANEESKQQEEAERNSEAQWESYYEMLREYKQLAWKGEKPFVYMFYGAWGAVDGINNSWLQSLPDSLTAISLWGGWAREPETLTENQIFDLNEFHKKGGTVFTCYQVSRTGQGLPGGVAKFIERYGDATDDAGEKAKIKYFARDLARHIIALNLDGFDIDWEPTVGDHGSGYGEFIRTQNRTTTKAAENIIVFIQEVGKYFGSKYSGEERKQYLRDLFDETIADYHPNESEFIRKYKPYFEKHNAVDKKFYLLHDGQYFPMTQELDKYFDKFIMQDYGRVDDFATYLNSWTVGGTRSYTPPAHRVASIAELEKGQYPYLPIKAKQYKIKNGGIGAYKGTDLLSKSSDEGFQTYMKTNGIAFRKYNHYAWFRESIRIMDPRSDEDYKNYKEELIIRKPNN